MNMVGDDLTTGWLVCTVGGLDFFPIFMSKGVKRCEASFLQGFLRLKLRLAIALGGRFSNHQFYEMYANIP